MSTPSPQGLPDPTLPLLVEALQEMRDALVRASLFLHDHQFELDELQRQQAMDHSRALLEKIKPK